MSPNYVRACFCIDRRLDLVDLESIGRALGNYGCEFTEPPSTNLGCWLEQPIAWQIEQQVWMARLLQISFNPFTKAMISFDVDDTLFFPDSYRGYYPGNDAAFAIYQDLMIALIKEIKPYIGVIDFEADLLCDDLTINSFAAWGNYLSEEHLRTWSARDLKILPNLADAPIKIDGFGLLIFNHPMSYGILPEKQVKLWKLIKSHFR